MNSIKGLNELLLNEMQLLSVAFKTCCVAFAIQLSSIYPTSMV